MYKLQCIICGGDIDIAPDGLTAKCKYCGCTLAFKKPLDDELKIKLHIAIDHQSKCEFSAARNLFLEISEKNEDLSEAWWGAFLSEYGIEFVSDKNGEKIPTCHRANVEPVFDNKYYKKAIETAADEVRDRYEKTASTIEQIRKGIIEKAESGVSYDVFICYKHTELYDDTRRTIDYELGKNIYDELTKEGYSVFFSAETLNRVAEGEFEPYIFKALSTAQVMLLLCSDVKKIESPWLKNEWNRFIEKTNGRGLIPICGNRLEPFKPTQLPYELQKLNAIVYDEKLIETIKTKLESFFEEKANQKRKKEKDAILRELERKLNDKLLNNGAQNEPTLDNYFARIETFISDRQFDEANAYCEKVLDLSPRNAKAYLYKACCSLRVSSLDRLWKINGLTSDTNFKHAKEFADDDELEYINELEDKNSKYLKELQENKRKKEIYERALNLVDNPIKTNKLSIPDISNEIAHLEKVIAACQEISGFKDIDDVVSKLQNELAELEKAKRKKEERQKQREEERKKKQEQELKEKALEEEQKRKARAEAEALQLELYERDKRLSRISRFLRVFSVLLFVATVIVGFLLRDKFVDKVSFYIMAVIALVTILRLFFVDTDEIITAIMILAEAILFIGIVVLDCNAATCINVFFGKSVWFIIAKWVFFFNCSLTLLLVDIEGFDETSTKLARGIGVMVITVSYTLACFFGVPLWFWISIASSLILHGVIFAITNY